MSYQIRILKIILFLVLLYPNSLRGEGDEQDLPENVPSSHLPSYYKKESPFRLIDNPDRKRAIFIPQLVSYFVPGFDQLLESQWESSLIYAASATAGLVYASDRAQKLGAENLKKESKNTYDSKNNEYRAYNFGNQIYQLAGGLSTYHSFRSAVRSRQPYGEFSFLREEETRSDLLLSPLRFDYMLRMTTWIPLAIAGGFAYLQNTPSSLSQNDLKSSPLKSADYFYSAAASYEAGISEEAMFRGWLLPAAHHELNSELLANLSQATVFALAHLGTVNIPIAQALLGYYLGALTIKNDWTISESIFIHSWWDVISFLAGYSTQKKNPNQKIEAPKFLVLPLEWHF